MNRTLTNIDTNPILVRDESHDTLILNGKLIRVDYESEISTHLPLQHSIKKLIKNGDLASFNVLEQDEAKTLLKFVADHIRSTDEKQITLIKQEIFKSTILPTEWTSSMWIQASRMLMRVSTELLEDNLELCGVTPFDVLFDGTRPFLANPLKIRALSVDKYDWEENKNFRNRFINPVIRFIEIGIPLQQSLLYENGVEPESLFKEAGWFRSLTPSLFNNALVPSILNKKAKSNGFFSFHSEPTTEEIKEYRKNLYSNIQKEIEKVEENNLTKNRVNDTESVATLSHESEAWIKEKINLYHPKSLLEINCSNTVLTKYASEIGIQCVSLQKSEAVCDKVYRESKKLTLNNLCVNSKITAFTLHSFEMVILNAQEYKSATLQTYSRQDLFALLSKLSSKYLIIETESTDWGGKFDLIELSNGFVLLKKVERSLNVV